MHVINDPRAPAPNAGAVAYDVNVPFWSDGAAKRRWFVLPPGGHVTFRPNGAWSFPDGSVFVKHFESDGQPIETRVLVKDQGGVRGATYKWRADRSDAERVDEAAATRGYYFPSPTDCATCHTSAAGLILGVNTRQLNRPDAHGVNQLDRLSRRGIFGGSPLDKPSALPRLVPADQHNSPIADRARSYLDANCANCHRPGGVAGTFDARFETPLIEQNLIGGGVLIDLGLDHARVVAPNDPWRSIALARVATLEQTKMPPIGHQTIDRAGLELLRAWIGSLPGPSVLAPPSISPAGGEFRDHVEVTLRHPDRDAEIRYTLDGRPPVPSSAKYEGPIRLTDPATLRARAFKSGFTRSVTVQETFVVER